DVLVIVHPDAATRRAIRADALLRFEKPDSLLVQKVVAAQRPNRAEVNDVPRQLVVERLAWEDVDLGVMPPADDLQLGRAADLAREADAARAHDAAIGEQRNVRANVWLVGRRVLLVDHPARGFAEAIAEVLQQALARLVAHRA